MMHPVRTKSNFALRRYNNSALVGTDELNTQKPQIKIYPNPSNGRFILMAEKPVQKLEILNMSGICIYATVIAATTACLDLSAFAKGVYVYKTLDESGRLSFGKLVIE